ncbi:MAG: RNA-binding protein [Deltaproteobacteria bacterium RIFOXYD12_FULL_57_12]|nr:MAG: RNA-binding protein [Deltaproteobacteria bacterium RIFOXYD12_FULL_57_12]
MGEEEKVRIDKWLWAARFFKTRSMAAEAVTGGLVHVNASRVKPARSIQLGDELTIRRGVLEFVVIVRGLSEKRGPATVARELYEETPESIAAREKNKEELFLQRAATLIYGPVHRPNKRDRRQIRSFTRKARSE